MKNNVLVCQVQLLVRKKHDVLFSALPHIKFTKSSGLADLLIMTLQSYAQVLPSHPEKHLVTVALFLDGSLQLPPPSPWHPRCPRLDAAA